MSASSIRQSNLARYQIGEDRYSEREDKIVFSNRVLGYILYGVSDEELDRAIRFAHSVVPHARSSE